MQGMAVEPLSLVPQVCPPHGPGWRGCPLLQSAKWRLVRILCLCDHRAREADGAATAAKSGPDALMGRVNASP